MSVPSDEQPARETGPLAAEAYLWAMADFGVDALYAVAGTDFPSIIEAYGRSTGTERKLPAAYTVPHENLAVAMAHGHALRSGKPQAAMVHVSVGTANMVCGALNAIRDGVPVLLSAGRTPVTEDGPHGTRNRFIHWAQEMFDQGAMIREAVKWDYELRTSEQVEDVLARSLEIASAPPPGPVYLSLPRELMAQEVNPVRPKRKLSKVSEPAADPDAIDRLADRIAKAKYPVIVTSNVGRDQRAVVELSALVEEWAIPVIQYNARSVNLSFNHPMALGFDSKDGLEHADLIISIACDVPWVPSVMKVKPTATLVEIDQDPLFSRYPMRTFSAAESITASPWLALRALRQALGKPGSQAGEIINQRRRLLTTAKSDLTARLRPDESRLTADSASAVIGRHLPRNAVVVNEYSFKIEQAQFEEPGQFYGFTPAGGLGFGFGAALGIACAGTDGPVVVMLGDGAYMFNNPTACHWAAAAHKLPVLTIVFNNRRWGAVRNSTLAMYGQGGAAATDGMFLADLSPSPDYAAIVRTHDGYGETVSDLETLPAALDRALAAVAAGTQATICLEIAS